jgi:hypothetical protein
MIYEVINEDGKTLRIVANEEFVKEHYPNGYKDVTPTLDPDQQEADLEEEDSLIDKQIVDLTARKTEIATLLSKKKEIKIV